MIEYPPKPITDNTQVRNYRKNVVDLEDAINATPGSHKGDYYPLKHTFADGMYIREISMPKGALFVTKIHKFTHPYFVLKGDVSVLTEEGVIRIKAPYSGITKAGTKRVLYCHEDTVWTTIHKTDKTDLKKIEEEVIAKNFDEIENTTKLTDFITEVQKGDN